MSHSGPSLDLKHKPLPNENFLGWLKSSTSLVAGQIAIVLSVLLYMGTFVYYVPKMFMIDKSGLKDKFGQYDKYIFIANIIALFIFIFYSRKLLTQGIRGKFHAKEVYRLIFGERFIESKTNKGHMHSEVPATSDNANKKTFDEVYDKQLNKGAERMKIFMTCIQHYWIFALIYYAATIVLKSGLEGASNLKLNIVISHAMECSQVVMMFRCYLAMVQINPESKGNWLSGLMFKNFFLPAVGLILFLPMILVFYMPNDIPIDMEVDTAIHSIQEIFMVIVGLSNSVVIGLLVSRLDSKFICLPSYLVLILYGYALIQPVFNVLPEDDGPGKILRTTIYFCAFVFKVYFFLIILYAFQTGRLLSYFTNSVELTSRLKELRYSKPGFKKENIYPLPKTFYYFQKLKGVLFIAIIIAITTFIFFQVTKIYYAEFRVEFELGLKNTRQVLQYCNFFLAILFAAILFIRLRSKKYQVNISSDISHSHADHIYNQLYDKRPANFPKTRSESKKIVEVLNKFTKLFMFFWIVLVLYYGFNLFEQEYIPKRDPWLQILFSFIEITLNNYSVFFLLCCFAILYSYSQTNTDRVLKNMIYNSGMVITMLAIAQFTLMMYLFKHPEDSNLRQFHFTVFPIISGVLNAFGMAMLVGRLDSKFFGQHHYTIALLLTYASLQPLFLIFFKQHDTRLHTELVVLCIALVLKLFLFIVVYSAINYGGLFTYLRCFKELDSRMDTIFANQFEIVVYPSGHEHHGKFTYCIKHKDNSIFTSFKHFSSHHAALEHIDELRSSIKSGDCDYLFSQKEDFGAYRIELTRELNGKEDIGYSKYFSTKEKCLELQMNINQMLPYCKVHLTH